jgi:hypothetical protein
MHHEEKDNGSRHIGSDENGEEWERSEALTKP